LSVVGWLITQDMAHSTATVLRLRFRREITVSGITMAIIRSGTWRA